MSGSQLIYPELAVSPACPALALGDGGSPVEGSKDCHFLPFTVNHIMLFSSFEVASKKKAEPIQALPFVLRPSFGLKVNVQKVGKGVRLLVNCSTGLLEHTHQAILPSLLKL